MLFIIYKVVLILKFIKYIDHNKVLNIKLLRDCNIMKKNKNNSSVSIKTKGIVNKLNNISMNQINKKEKIKSTSTKNIVPKKIKK